MEQNEKTKKRMLNMRAADRVIIETAKKRIGWISKLNGFKLKLGIGWRKNFGKSWFTWDRMEISDDGWKKQNIYYIATQK